MENANNPVVSAEQPGQGAMPDPVVGNRDWSSVSFFKVKCKERENVTAKVYSNGGQYVVITVDIIAKNSNGEEVSLSQAQLDSIKLIKYVGGDTYLGVLEVYNSPPYDFINDFPLSGFGAERDVAGDDLQNGVQRKTFYVTGINKNTDTHKLAARIITPTGVSYTTNTEDPEPGKFNSYVNVECVRPIVHGRHSMGDVTYRHLDEQGSISGFIFSANFRDSTYRVVKVEPDYSDPYYFYCGYNESRSRYSHMVSVPGPTEITSYCYHNHPYKFVGISQKEVSALHMVDKDHYLEWKRDIPGSFTVSDQYGNQFRLEWYETEKGNSISLRDSPDPFT